MTNKIRYLKPLCQDNKVISAEWIKIKQDGSPPCGRIGHSMSYLLANDAILIVGGRNDEECKNMSTPYLEDIHIYLLD